MRPRYIVVRWKTGRGVTGCWYYRDIGQQLAETTRLQRCGVTITSIRRVARLGPGRRCFRRDRLLVGGSDV